MLLLALGLTASGAWRRAAAFQPEPPPRVVRVDEVGRAEMLNCLPEAVAPTSPETPFFIRRFVVDQYEQRAAVLEERWSRSSGRLRGTRCGWRTWRSGWSLVLSHPTPRRSGSTG